MDVYELLRLIRAGSPDREVAKLLGHNRRTVMKYRAWADREGLLAGELPDRAELDRRLRATWPAQVPPQQTSSLAPYAAEIATLREQGIELTAIRQRLQERHQIAVSYSAVRRLVQAITPPTAPEAVLRVEVAPGSEAQVDFGYAGLVRDPATGQLRKSWVFVLVLSWSRHLYAEIVWDQSVATWLACHEHAFAALGGVPARIVPDNLKAAIVRASFTEPVAQRAYRECAEHYGFRIDPTRPRTPQHKGKVESGVHYVARNFLAGRDEEELPERNRRLREWTMTVAGERIHGTTKVAPLARFRDVERAALLPLPPTPYDLAVWKAVRVPRDHHVVFDGAYYSVPTRYVGQTLWLRGGRRTVTVETAQHEPVWIHSRVAPGERQTVADHLPPEKRAALTLSRERVQQQAEAIGPTTSALVADLLAHRPEDRLRSAGRLVALAERYGPERLERACQRAQTFGQTDLATLKRILAERLDAQPLPGAPDPPAPVPIGRYTFARQAREFAGALWASVR